MQPPAPVTAGTGIFIGVFGIIILWFWAVQQSGRITKDSFQIISVIVVTLGLATWLMWLCAWMHQWHPLISPTYYGGAE